MSSESNLECGHDTRLVYYWGLIFTYHNDIEILSPSLGLYDGAFNTNQGLKA